MRLLGILLGYLGRVAQFQSLKSPFIVRFTIRLAFTGCFRALLFCGMELRVVSRIGCAVLLGMIDNKGIDLLDYLRQLRLRSMAPRPATVDG